MRKLTLLLCFVGVGSLWSGEPPRYPPTTEVRAAYRKLLDRPRIPLDAKEIKAAEVGAAAISERLTFASEKKADGSVERVPVLMLRPLKAKGKLPAVIVLHGTGGTKDAANVVSYMQELVKRGMIGVAIDARYHGARAAGGKGSAAYQEAILKAWRTKPGEPMEHPFYYDTVWDLWRLVDFLETRPDVDADKLGMIGFSMGGIQTWLAAAADERVRVIVPAIGVQSFRWSLENDQWQGRARTIQLAHDAAAKDLSEGKVNQKVCRALWTKIIPGILDEFDCPSMLRLCAGRPMMILSGTKDANCPYGGAKIAIESARAAYENAKAADRLSVLVEEVGHTVTPAQRQASLEWFERWLTREK